MTTTAEHHAAMKKVLRYVAGTVNYWCFFRKSKGSACLVGYVDSDLAGDVDQCRITSGVMFFLGENPMNWQSQKQK